MTELVEKNMVAMCVLEMMDDEVKEVPGDESMDMMFLDGAVDLRNDKVFEHRL